MIDYTFNSGRMIERKNGFDTNHTIMVYTFVNLCFRLSIDKLKKLLISISINNEVCSKCNETSVIL